MPSPRLELGLLDLYADTLPFELAGPGNELCYFKMNFNVVQNKP